MRTFFTLPLVLLLVLAVFAAMWLSLWFAPAVPLLFWLGYWLFDRRRQRHGPPLRPKRPDE